ncbi:MAG: amidohydrolase [Acidobacteriota bacterium]
MNNRLPAVPEIGTNGFSEAHRRDRRAALPALAAILASAAFLASCRPETREYADLVLQNGKVYTLDESLPKAEALAIKDGKIIYVGRTAGLARFMGPSTRHIDIGGRLALPGFIDSHCHPSGAVEQFFAASLFGLNSVREYQDAVRRFVEAHPGVKVVRGSGWKNTLFPVQGPHKVALDEIAPGIPVALSSEDGHSTWVNSKTLELAGITRATRDPPGGVIERDAKTGEPSGTLRETAADLIDEVIPEYTTDELVQGIEAYQTMALRLGITAAHDASISAGGADLKAYEAMEKAGRLRMRFRASLYVDPDKGVAQVKELVAERDAHTGPYFQTRAAKIFVDGVVEGVTAYLKEPYQHRPGFRGAPLWTADALGAACTALDRDGFQLHFHAIGDAAAAMALDAIAHAAAANGRRDARPLITHLQLVSPADVLRFRDLRAIAVPQPFWFMKDDYYTNLQVPFLGLPRADEEYPMESFFKAGVAVASASDYPVTIPCDPLMGIQTGITRARAGANRAEDVLWPAERATLDQMIRSFTINGAYANFLEKETGSIEVGKWADLVVLDKNLFEIPATEIGSARVLLTFFECRVAYQDASFSRSVTDD